MTSIEACDFYPTGHVIAERYRLVRPLGSGGMASVYLADDLLLGDGQVAIKVLRQRQKDNEQLIARFLREVQLTRKINHENVIRTYDFGHDRDTLYYTMEFVAGISLEQLLEAKQIEIEEALGLMRQLLRGMSAVHAAGIVHRDLKPANVLLVSNQLLKISDFGIARGGASGLTVSSGEIMGTLAYVAPELLLGQSPTIAADYYSFASIAYQMLTRHAPFEDDIPARLLMRKVEECPDNPRTYRKDIPEWLAEGITALLDNDPNGRLNSYSKFIETFQRCVPDSGISLTATPYSDTMPLGDILRGDRAYTRVIRKLKLGWRFSTSLALLLVALVFIPLSMTGWYEQRNLEHLDLLFKIRGPRAPDPRVMIVAIDEQSYSNLGVAFTGAWPRELHAKLLDKLAADGASKVVFDILFVDNGNPQTDKELSRTIARVPTVLGAASAFSQKATLNGSFLLEELIKPTEALAAKAASLGIVGFPRLDGRVRNFMVSRSEIFPEIPSLAEAASGRSVKELGLTERSLVNYYGPSRTIPTVSFDMAISDDGSLPRGMFKDKIVFVGLLMKATAGPASQEDFVTPYDERTFGVELHATATSNLLSGDWLSRMPVWMEMAVGLLVAALSALPALLLSGWRIVSMAGVITVALLACQALFFAGGIFLPVGPALAIGFSSALLVRFVVTYSGHSRGRWRFG